MGIFYSSQQVILSSIKINTKTWLEVGQHVYCKKYLIQYLLFVLGYFNLDKFLSLVFWLEKVEESLVSLLSTQSF